MFNSTSWLFVLRGCSLKKPIIRNRYETVALLSKLDVDDHIKIEFGEDEISEIEFSKDPTYKEIQKFVLEKYGFKVSNLYIAQVKRKNGLIERKNYNVSKKEKKDRVIPHCPPEKEKAIEEALKWFGIKKDW